MTGEIITTVNDNITLAELASGQRFGTDALLLAALAERSAGCKAVEIGTGSGIVSLLCADRDKFSHIDALEVQQPLAELCGRNIERNNLSDIITAICADVREYAQNTSAVAAYDAALCNPPYMRADSGRRSADPGRDGARRELNGGITEICSSVARLLRRGGVFYIVYRPDRAVDLVCALRAASLEPKKLVFVCDEAGRAPCLMLVAAIRGAGRSLEIAPPFILRDRGAPTSEYAYLLENGSFPG